MRRSLLVLAGVAVSLPLRAVVAQMCDTISSVTSMSALSGARVRSVRIVTLAPPGLPRIARPLDALHVRTRERTVRRQLLFSAGDTLDTLAVGESIRRLRRDRYLRDVTLIGVRCGREPVDLVLTTRDEWSVKPKVQVRSAGTSELGLTERNLLGTGREVSIHMRSQEGRVGIGVRLHDPWFLGSRLDAVIGQDAYRDGRQWIANFRLREETVRAPWGFEVGGVRAQYKPAALGTDQFERASAHVLLRRRLFDGVATVGSVLAGVETERAALRAGTGSALVGPSRVDRDFYGLSLGAARASVAYDTLTWMLPNDAIVDVPTAAEAEVVAGVGRDVASTAQSVHLDLWAGKAWLPTRRSLALADVWMSAYASRGGWDAATFRASLAIYGAATNGFWTTRVSAERLLNPDPDVRSFVTSDPTMRLLSDNHRLAASALGLVAERDLRLRSLSRSWALDGAVFAAASSRWQTAAPGPEHVEVAAVGLGLRLAPTRLGRATARLDLGLPVAGSSVVSRRPYVAIGLSPWWGDGRHRAGRPEY